ncbi:DUF397 domain-containing protein [Cryptosporangium sp. NPDC048952]|uniref:DUF397 domain-containing protein n=1 Tax=Cryptosporangium sp. NPDC048952 TaxID=3363961 RepID=UPI00371EA168
MMDMVFEGWRKSSYSSGYDNCVEWVVAGSDVVGVRDSKNPDGPVLVLTRRQWQSFIDGLKIGIDDE